MCGSSDMTVSSNDYREGCDETVEVDRFWDPFRLGLFALIFGPGLAAGLTGGVGFSSWWLGLLSFAVVCGGYGLMALKCPRNELLRLMDPLTRPRKKSPP